MFKKNNRPKTFDCSSKFIEDSFRLFLSTYQSQSQIILATPKSFDGKL